MDKGRKHGSRDLCAQLHEDDGIDPRHERRGHDRVCDIKLQRKDEQLAKFALRAAEHVLTARTDAPDVGASVLDAEVKGSGSHVLVRVCFKSNVDRRVAEQWLAALAPQVRTELAWRLNRKRTPSVRLQWALAPDESTRTEHKDNSHEL